MRKTAPSKNSIINYWCEQATDDTFNVDAGDLRSGLCWRCTDDVNKRKHGLHRCHIVPHSLKGLNEPKNFVLLCKRCHDEAPDTLSSVHFFRWLKRDSEYAQVYGYFWMTKGFKEALKHIDETEFINTLESIGIDELNKIVKDVVQNNTSTHLSSRHGNIKKPSTYEYIIYEIFDRVLKKRQEL